MQIYDHNYRNLQAEVSKTQYSWLHKNQLEQVTEDKYFGVIMTNTLSWSIHISSISSKAFRDVVPSFLSLHGSAQKLSTSCTSRALICPCLEYVAPACMHIIWSPRAHHSTKGANYSNLLDQYQTPNLDVHRQYLGLSHALNFMWGFCRFPVSK